RVLAASPGVIELDPIPYLSRDGRCMAEDAGHALYYDYQHLTRYGAAFLKPMFANLIRRVAPHHAAHRHRPSARLSSTPQNSSNRLSALAKSQSPQPFIRASSHR
ncbi:MAG TPA: SGNH hydrolase domain-containing protein, partial [Opitutus sp.]|nr:SGNH hydrolase domain-containing protein [Opitutus sp.]